MESFFRTHAYLVEHTNAPVRRILMDEIDWNDRMIGIKGTRGVGKTTFLLQYAKMAPTPLEQTESLEQLRALENGYKIKVIETQSKFVGVDTPEDLAAVNKIFNERLKGPQM